MIVIRVSMIVTFLVQLIIVLLVFIHAVVESKQVIRDIDDGSV